MRLLSFLLYALAAYSQNVRITWIGQACFYIQSEGGALVVTDPPAANIGYTLPATAADAVTVSHGHADHNFSAGVRGTFTLVDGTNATERTTLTAGGLPFVRIPGFHDNTNGSARGRNTIITWTQNGLKFAHFGDYGQDSLTATQLADLQDVDFLMIPAGGSFTTDPARLPALIDQVRPRVTLLMHFRTGIGGPAQLPSAPAVAHPFGSVRFLPSSVTVSRALMPPSPEIWVMEPAADAIAVNSATNLSGPPVAPGSLATFWGNFGTFADAASPAPPLVTRLNAAEVVIGTTAVPLLYASPRQINFQVPRSLAAGQYAIEARLNGQRTARGVVTVAERAPGVFLAVDLQGRVNRARRGSFLIIYGTGQGATSNAPADGAAAPLSPLAQSTATPVVTLAGRTLNVSFSGLAPNFAGLWQINAEIPADLATGNAGLTVQAGGFTSNAVPIVID